MAFKDWWILKEPKGQGMSSIDESDAQVPTAQGGRLLLSEQTQNRTETFGDIARPSDENGRTYIATSHSCVCFILGP